MADWVKFLKAVQSDPKNFAQAIIDHLHPPKYVAKELQRFEWKCDYCWKVRADICMGCDRSVCREHIALTIVGPKTQLEWYVCPDCLKLNGEEALRKRANEEDYRFWLEDQTEAKST